MTSRFPARGSQLTGAALAAAVTLLVAPLTPAPERAPAPHSLSAQETQPDPARAGGR